MGRCSDGDVRLVNGSVPNEGLVEICYNGRWGAICQDHWERVDAAIVCRQMGFPADSELITPTVLCLLVIHLSYKIVLMYISAQTLSHTYIIPEFILSLFFSPSPYFPLSLPTYTPPYLSSALSLSSFSLLLLSSVLLSFHSLSLSLLPLSLPVPDPPGVIAVGKSLFSSSSGPIFLDSVDCQGAETRLDQCFDRSWLGAHNCRDDSGHAGVICPCELLTLPTACGSSVYCSTCVLLETSWDGIFS